MKPVRVPFEHWSASRFLCWEQCPAEFSLEVLHAVPLRVGGGKLCSNDPHAWRGPCSQAKTRDPKGNREGLAASRPTVAFVLTRVFDGRFDTIAGHACHSRCFPPSTHGPAGTLVKIGQRVDCAPVALGAAGDSGLRTAARDKCGGGETLSELVPRKTRRSSDGPRLGGEGSANTSVRSRGDSLSLARPNAHHEKRFVSAIAQFRCSVRSTRAWRGLGLQTNGQSCVAGGVLAVATKWRFA